MRRQASLLTLLLALAWTALLAACSPTAGPPAPTADLARSSTATPAPAASAPPAPTPIGGGTGAIAFSSYRDGESDLYLLDVQAAIDGAGERAIRRLTDDDERVNQPTWSPDGRHLAYSRRREGKYREIWAMPFVETQPDGRSSEPVRLVSNFRALDSEPAWSPGGTQLAFTSSQDSYVDVGDRAGIRLDIYLTNLDGSGQARLLQAADSGTQKFDRDWNSSPVWSPGGSEIAFQTNRDGNNEVYVAAADGSSLRNLTRHPASDASPAWSPDGERIAFVSDRDGNEEIYVVDADGTNLRRLTRDPGPDKSPAWSPDGQWLVFHTDRYTQNGNNFDLHLVKADGTDVIRLTTNINFDGFAAWQPAIAPDFVVELPAESLPIDGGRAVPSEVAAWLAKHAIPLATVEPTRLTFDQDIGLDDLAPLGQLIGDRRIVDLGGSNFGSHEALAARHRIVQYLVEELAFNTLVLDVSREDAALINAYIHTRAGDPGAIFDSLDDPRLNNEEVRYLVEWLRVHNENPGEAPQVRFASLEPGDSVVPMDQVVAKLLSLGSKGPGDKRALQQPLYPHLADRHADGLENARLLAQEAGSDGRYIVWTHHFRALGTALDEDSSFGSLARRPLAAWALSEHYGEEPYVIGFAYGIGAFTVYDTLNEEGRLQNYPLPAPPPGSFEWTARRAGPAAFLLPLEGIAPGNAATAWLYDPLLFRQVIASYDASRLEAHFYPVRLPHAFDAILYVDRVTPVRLLWLP